MSINLDDYSPLHGYDKGYAFFTIISELLQDNDKIKVIVPDNVGLEWLDGLYHALFDNGYTESAFDIENYDESLLIDICEIVTKITLDKKHKNKILFNFLLDKIKLFNCNNDIQFEHYCSMFVGAIVLAEKYNNIDIDKAKSLILMISEIEKSVSTNRPHKIKILSDYLFMLNGIV